MSPVDDEREGLTLAPRRDNKEEMDGVKEYWATKCKHTREATEDVEENPKEEERCEAQHTSSVTLCVQLVSRESESGGYIRAEDERDWVSLVPAVGKSTCANKRRRLPSTLWQKGSSPRRRGWKLMRTSISGQ